MSTGVIGASSAVASSRESSRRSSTISRMRSAWRRMSATGSRHSAPIPSSLRQLVEVAGDHGERRAQLVRGVGDEVLAHLLEPHLARDVAHQHQELRAGRDHEQREPGIAALDVHDDAVAAVGPAEVGRELRVAHQVRDRYADVHLAPEAEKVRGRAVEPADLPALRQQHDAVRQRGREAPEFAELLR